MSKAAKSTKTPVSKGQTSLFSFFSKVDPKKNVNKDTAGSTGPVGTGPNTPNTPLSGRHDITTTTPSARITTNDKLKDAGSNSSLPTPETPHDEATNNTSVGLSGLGSSPAVGELPSSPVKRARKRISYIESDDDDADDDVVSKKPTRVARRRVAVDDDDDDDDDEYKHSETSEDEELVDAFVEKESDVDMDEDEDENDIVPSKSKSKSKSKSSFKKSPSSYSSSPDAISVDIESTSKDISMFTKSNARNHSTTPSRKPTVATSGSTGKVNNGFGNNSGTSFEKMNEERYQWLEVIRDADGRYESDPEYDPRTLYIPKSAWSKFTPFEKQYWEIKSKMWNTVVFFKKGKFYELYERDADIAHNEFDLKLAGGGRANMRLAGIPEMSFDFWASSFIAKGHKVAKVDQMESALAKEMRDKSGKSKKEEKIVKRELACVLTAGTLTDEAMLVDEMSTYCMAIKQQNKCEFGVCFVDTATGMFLVSQFVDDTDYSQLETMLAQTRPRELLLEKGRISQKAIRIIKNNTSVNTIWNYLKPDVEFWDRDASLESLIHGQYFEAEDLDDFTHYPELLRDICKDESKGLALSAFGGLLWYLKHLLIDKSLVSQGSIKWYSSIQKATSMVLDGQSLQNLEIFANTYDGGSDGTLFKLVNRCITPFGKRMLKKWVCHPLMDVDKINKRLDVVDFLQQRYAVVDVIVSKLANLPDLERSLSRIHAGQLKVKDFVRVIESFESIYDMVSKIHGEVEECELLNGLVTSLPEALQKCLPKWTEAFDRVKAKTSGELIPEPGVEPSFDASLKHMSDIEAQLQSHLKQYKKDLGSFEVCYRDSGKEIYLIEVPIKACKRVPDNWFQMGTTSKVKRYWSPEVKVLVRSLLEARELHKVVTDELQLKLFKRFDEDYDVWLQAAQACANIDCLISLYKTSTAIGSPSCRPEFVIQKEKDDGQGGLIRFKELRHPCFNSSKGDFIPNDISLGGEDEANIALLTGANAAGKSTVLRMTCVAVIMAQIGCYVPAESAKLTAVDRIMTRLGANDNIFAGKSTFYVELSETQRMLSEATNRSLLVLDELGRGGSSSDGFAIAEAVLHHIATYVNSLGFFATHYGTLMNSFLTHPKVKPQRMAILVDDDSSKRQVTFLYKLEDGAAPGSFGMHVATMCGIDKSIVDRAEVAAKEFEHTSRMKRLLDLTKVTDNIPLGLESDFVWATRVPDRLSSSSVQFSKETLKVLLSMIPSE